MEVLPKLWPSTAIWLAALRIVRQVRDVRLPGLSDVDYPGSLLSAAILHAALHDHVHHIALRLW